MRTIGRLPFVLAVLALVTCGIGNSQAQAGEVLVNGTLESSVSPVSWSLETSVTGMPGTTVPSAFEHNDGANNPPVAGLGLLLHPPAGNQGLFAGQNKMINLVLEQTFGSAVAGRTYTFKGDANLQDGYSGIVDTLNALTPLGDYNLDTVVNAADYTIWRDTLGSTTDFRANGTNEGASLDLIDQADYDYWKARFGAAGRPAGAPSPTETTFEMAFLNSSDAVLGIPIVFDLRDDPTTLAWRTNMVMGMAPPGTAKVRVRVSALDMVDNCCSAGQDVMFDNFSLRDSQVPALERLSNGNLNTPGDPQGFTLTEGPTVDQGLGPVTADSAAFIGFANHTTGGAQGLWLRPFVNVTQFEPDITSVDAVMSQVVAGSAGADYSFSAWSRWEVGYSGALLNTTTETTLALAFLDASSAVIGTPLTLDLLDAGQVADNMWRQFSVNGTAPAGTASLRVSVAGIGMFHSFFDPQSAFFDDLSLIETLPGSAALAGAVPEPSSLLLVGIAMALAGAVRRKR